MSAENILKNRAARRDRDQGSGNIPQHWFMVAGEIIAEDPEGASVVAHVNTVSFTRDGRIPLVAIGRLQQQLQMQFMSEVNNTSFVIGKVTILSIMPLGLMTAAEFNAAPKGMALNEIGTEPPAGSA